jgi:hypothetical protein
MILSFSLEIVGRDRLKGLGSPLDCVLLGINSITNQFEPFSGLGACCFQGDRAIDA